MIAGAANQPLLVSAMGGLSRKPQSLIDSAIFGIA
jgi:hypothetical protein